MRTVSQVYTADPYTPGPGVPYKYAPGVPYVFQALFMHKDKKAAGRPPLGVLSSNKTGRVTILLGATVCYNHGEVKSMQVLILGCGRLGSALALRLAELATLWLWDGDPEAAASLACRTGGRALAGPLPAPVTAFLALPAEALPQVLEGMQLPPGSTVLNCATTAPTRPLLAHMRPGVNLAWAKFVGHAREIAAGARPVIITGGVLGMIPKDLVNLLEHVGTVLPGDEELVRDVNQLVTAEALRCVARIQRQLESKDLPPQVIHAALSCTAPGTIKAAAGGDLGPFARQLMAQLRESPSG